MGKKKKAVIQKAYTTTSIPKRKLVVEQQETQEFSKEDEKRPLKPSRKKPEAKVKEKEPAFAINADIPHFIVTGLRHKPSEPPILKLASEFNVASLPILKFTAEVEQNIIDLTREADELSSEPIRLSIKELHTIYICLMEDYGFEVGDVRTAMKAVGGGPILKVLNHLCLFLPNEKLPAGWADKYYHNREENVSRVIISGIAINENNKGALSARPEQSPLATLKTQPEETQPVTKDWILQYALEAEDTGMNEEEMALAAHMHLQHQPKTSKKKKNTLAKKDERSKVKTELSKEQTDDLVADAMANLFDADGNFYLSTSEEPASDDITKYSENVTKENCAQKIVLNGETIESDIKASSKEFVNEPLVLDEATGVVARDLEREVVSDDESELDSLDLGVIEALSTDVTSDEIPQNRNLEYREFKIPQSWTGKIPKQTFIDWCRQNGQSQPKYESVGPIHWKSRVSFKDQKENAHDIAMSADDCLCRTKLEADNYVSVLALYKMNASKSLQRILPQPFADLWLELERKAQDHLAYELKTRVEDVYAFLRDLVAIPKTKEASTKVEVREQSRDAKEQPGTNINPRDHLREIFRKRNFRLQQARDDLPVAKHREEILEALDNSKVIIVCGETGSGKSTQVPQFIVEQYLRDESVESCNVVCAQPRRISAVSLATRVSQELADSSVGGICGYRIRLENRVSDSTMLCYCTNGILLRQLEGNLLLDDVTHVVLDEIHERDLNSDFLLLILKRIRKQRPELKLVLMSATINADEFANYFKGSTAVPIINVSGRTFPVKSFYLEDAIEMTRYMIEEDLKKSNHEQFSYDVSKLGPGIDAVDYAKTASKAMPPDFKHYFGNFSKRTQTCLLRVDESRVDMDLIEAVLQHICFSPDMRGDGDGAILIFLPGIGEIRNLYDQLSVRKCFSDGGAFVILPLHSSLSGAEQSRVFDTFPAGIRKIVLSTNIAETGVTISDVTHVIDAGRAKEVRYDVKSSMQTLVETLISRANARQRRGRAGRVKPGVCFHLFTRLQHDTQMTDFQKPEILRLPLEELCLKIKSCGYGDIATFLSEAITSPPAKAVTAAITTLSEIQALDPEDQSLTPLGKHLSMLPVDVHIGKMLIMGAIFRCIDPIATIAACISSKNPFVRPFGRETEADRAREQFKSGISDLLTWRNAYTKWRSVVLNKGAHGSRTFCSKNYLSFTTLCQIEESKKRFFEVLASAGFLSEKIERVPCGGSLYMYSVAKEYSMHSDSFNVVSGIICAGLYPKIVRMHKNTLMTMPETKGGKSTAMQVSVHPSSINFGCSLKDGDWFAYHMIVKSKKVYLWDINRVSLLSVVLFGGDITIYHKDRVLGVGGSRFLFRCAPKTAAVIFALRKALDELLNLKISKPDADQGSFYGRVINEIAKLLHEDILL